METTPSPGILNRPEGLASPERPASQAAQSAKDDEKTALKKACAEMESLFVFHLLQEMRTAGPKEGLLHGGMGEDIFTSLMDGEMARSIALERGLGLARMLENQLSQQSTPNSMDSIKPPGARVVKSYGP